VEKRPARITAGKVGKDEGGLITRKLTVHQGADLALK
jgi:hypothetical protein